MKDLNNETKVEFFLSNRVDLTKISNKEDLSAWLRFLMSKRFIRYNSQYTDKDFMAFSVLDEVEVVNDHSTDMFIEEIFGKRILFVTSS